MPKHARPAHRSTYSPATDALGALRTTVRTTRPSHRAEPRRPAHLATRDWPHTDRLAETDSTEAAR